ncbi:MAG: hypothetical protein QXS20_01540 [Candidatus Thorarchaeota archaeon]
MSTTGDDIEQIRIAEEEAKKRVAEAERKASETKAEAEAESQRILAEAEQRAESQAALIAARKQTHKEELEKRYRDEVKRSIEKIESQARERMAPAVDKLLKILLSED